MNEEYEWLGMVVKANTAFDKLKKLKWKTPLRREFDEKDFLVDIFVEVAGKGKDSVLLFKKDGIENCWDFSWEYCETKPQDVFEEFSHELKEVRFKI